MTGKHLKVIFLWLGLVLTVAPVLANDNPWTININIPECRLFLHYHGELFKTYKVAVGKTDSPSPTGEFQIINKVINPTWYPEKRAPIPPGPKNPLGKYWMGLNNKGYGIHGNSAAWSIGAPASKGCFRMDNHEIEEIFTLVPVGTPVKINYNVIKGKIDKDNQAWLEIYPDIYHRLNLEMNVQQVLNELNWEYQPHIRALALLITTPKPLIIMVPRKIRIDGDYQDSELDGFYWNDQIYLSRKYFEKNDTSALMASDNLFQKYINCESMSISEAVRKGLKWDEVRNTLRVYDLKVMLNNERIEGVGRFESQGKLLVNYSKIDNWLKDKQLPKPNITMNAQEETRLIGEFHDGQLWIEPKKMTINFRGFSFYFDEVTLTLFLYYTPIY